MTINFDIIRHNEGNVHPILTPRLPIGRTSGKIDRLSDKDGPWLGCNEWALSRPAMKPVIVVCVISLLAGYLPAAEPAQDSPQLQQLRQTRKELAHKQRRVIFNNDGIYRGTDVNKANSDPATTVFVKGARYDKMMEAFGGVGVNATSPDELKRAVNEAMDSGKPTLINAVIDPAAGSESGRIGNLNPQSVLKKK